METRSGVGTRKAPTDDVTASELATFAYCAKAWHLERVLGIQPMDRAVTNRDDGVIGHERHGRSVRVGAWLGRHGMWAMLCLVVLAVVFGVLAILAV